MKRHNAVALALALALALVAVAPSAAGQAELGKEDPIHAEVRAVLKAITAAYNAGRVAGALIRRVEPLMGVAPMKEPPNQPFPIIARLGYGADADKTSKE